MNSTNVFQFSGCGFEVAVAGFVSLMAIPSTSNTPVQPSSANSVLCAWNMYWPGYL